MVAFNKKIIFILLIAFSMKVIAQSGLVVYQIEGNIKVKQTNKKLYIGTLIDPKASIIIEKGSTILLDEKSNMYQVSEKGTLSFNDIKKKKLVSKSKSVSKRYLSYIYKKFLKIEEKKSIYGAVFRGNKFLNTPENYSYFKTNSFVAFNWKSTGEKEFYLWVLNAKNHKIVSKVKLDYANSLSLLLPFKKGVYKWTVTTENTLENTKAFNIFEIVKPKEFEKRENDPFYKAKKEVNLVLKN